MLSSASEIARTRRDMRALETDPEFAELRGIVDAFTPITPVVSQLLDALAGGVVGWTEVARIVRRDAALAARALAVANTAAHSGEGKVDSIEAASQRLGTQGLNEVILAAAMAFVAQHDNLGYAITGPSMWRWCIGMGQAAAQLAARVPGLRPEVAYTGGLVADIGKIALGRLAASRGLRGQTDDFSAAERAVFGVDHPTVSAWMLHRWGLPFELVCGVRWHHQPDVHSTDLADVLHAASHVAAATCAVGVDGLQYPLSARVRARHLGGGVMEATMLAVADALARSAVPRD